MKHILLIDPLEKLTVKKDSTLLFAHSLKECGNDVYVLYEDDLLFENAGNNKISIYSFESKLYESSFYLEKFENKEKLEVSLDENTMVHMRLDPPFDARYLQYLWLLNGFKKYGVKLINDPNGILLNNEKIVAYELKNSIPTFIGKDPKHFLNFINSANYDQLIFKPVDLYQGIGVEKVSVDENIERKFKQKVEKLNAPVVVQPFIKDVENGEIRSSFFKGQHMGSILKVPPKGEFLANIAQGASFHSIDLEDSLMQECLDVCNELSKVGIEWLAFDILGNKISEVNITCPGLIVEISEALNENVALKMAKLL